MTDGWDVSVPLRRTCTKHYLTGGVTSRMFVCLFVLGTRPGITQESVNTCFHAVPEIVLQYRDTEGPSSSLQADKEQFSD